MTIHVLTHATVLTFDSQDATLEDGAIAFSASTGNILAVGGTPDVVAQYPHAVMHDCRSQIVTPGMVNTHTHLFQTLLKGLGADKPLSDWISSMTLPAAAHLTWDDCYVAALHGCIEALTTGTTTLLDFMYVHPQPELIDAVVAAMTDCGIRGVAARGYVTSGGDVGIPRSLIEPIDAALEDARRAIAVYNRPGSLVQVGLGPMHELDS